MPIPSRQNPPAPQAPRRKEADLYPYDRGPVRPVNRLKPEMGKRPQVSTERPPIQAPEPVEQQDPEEDE